MEEKIIKIMGGINTVILGIFLVATKSGQNILDWCLTTIKSGIHSVGGFFVWIFALITFAYFALIVIDLFMIIYPDD